MKRILMGGWALVLAGLLVFSAAVPAVAAPAATVSLNGKPLAGTVVVDGGISTVDGGLLAGIPGIGGDVQGPIPLRAFFEDRGATVHWDVANNQVWISWREFQDGWSADALIAESGVRMQDAGSYRMVGDYVMDMSVRGGDPHATMDLSGILLTMDAGYSYDPLAIYIRQVMEMPAELLGVENGGETIPVTTEMVLTADAIYQKIPAGDVWVRVDLGELGWMNNLTQYLQSSPQQSLEMMQELGIIQMFGESESTDTEEYFVVDSYADGRMLREYLGDILTEIGITAALEELEAGSGVDAGEIQAVIDALIASLEMEYTYRSWISKETLFTEKMDMEMTMSFALDGSVIPEGPMEMRLGMNGSYTMMGFGDPVELPDLDGAMTQQEYMEWLQAQ